MENNPKLSYQYLNKWDGGGQGSWQNSWGARNQISFNIKVRTDWSSEVLIVTTTKSKPNLSALTQVCNNNIKRKCFPFVSPSCHPEDWGPEEGVESSVLRLVNRPPHSSGPGSADTGITHNGRQTSDMDWNIGAEKDSMWPDLATANIARAERRLTKIDTNGH